MVTTTATDYLYRAIFYVQMLFKAYIVLSLNLILSQRSCIHQYPNSSLSIASFLTVSSFEIKLQSPKSILFQFQHCSSIMGWYQYQEVSAHADLAYVGPTLIKSMLVHPPKCKENCKTLTQGWCTTSPPVFQPLELICHANHLPYSF